MTAKQIGLTLVGELQACLGCSMTKGPGKPIKSSTHVCAEPTPHCSKTPGPSTGGRGGSSRTLWVTRVQKQKRWWRRGIRLQRAGTCGEDEGGL